MNITYSFDVSDVSALSRRIAVSSSRYRWARRAVLLIGAAVVFSAAWPGEESQAPFWAYMVVGVFGIAIWAVLLWLLTRFLSPLLNRFLFRKAENPMFGQPVTLTLAGDYFTIESPHSSGKTKWSLVHRFDVTSTHAFLFVGSFQAYVIPRAKVVSGDFDAFTAEATRLWKLYTSRN
ncbi:MAG: YcxB family protein [Candidatus Lernaella stagnicola]|nr:YcxB family protein [Candidatus Lernaella stagnicola]